MMHIPGEDLDNHDEPEGTEGITVIDTSSSTLRTTQMPNCALERHWHRLPCIERLTVP